MELRVKRLIILLPEGAWPNWTLSNHDKHRVASRIGISQAKIRMMLLLTLRGTPTILLRRRTGNEGRLDSLRAYPRSLGKKISRYWSWTRS
ncbi:MULTISPECIES: alpha-amylase family glycosyl hydrolase [unclassified Microcoleus]|uniref:alpha-amylase family glycosyl hydrolase n=1 Tax=unclassified Microcoleus TaxID=2642155 RepID=UPI00403F09D1